MKKYESVFEDSERNDDITVVGFEIGKRSEITENLVEEIIKYEGVITQNVIATIMDNIESKITSVNLISVISTVTIELCQNMMNYSKNNIENSREIVPAGKIEVLCTDKTDYEIIATNIISIDDKNIIEPILNEIINLDKSEIKKRYKELRRSGKNAHIKGGGIGFYEIAKVSSDIDFDFSSVYNFKNINKDKYYFTIKVFIKPKKRS